MLATRIDAQGLNCKKDSNQGDKVHGGVGETGYLRHLRGELQYCVRCAAHSTVQRKGKSQVLHFTVEGQVTCGDDSAKRFCVIVENGKHNAEQIRVYARSWPPTFWRAKTSLLHPPGEVIGEFKMPDTVSIDDNEPSQVECVQGNPMANTQKRQMEVFSRPVSIANGDGDGKPVTMKKTTRMM